MGAIKFKAGSSFRKDQAGNVIGVSLKETGYGSRRKALWKFNDAVSAVVDNAGVGGQVCNAIGSFPQEFILIETIRVNLTFARQDGTTTSLSDTWDGDIGLGTTTGIGATLATTEQDIVATAAITQAVAGAAAYAANTNAVATPKDYTSATDLFLNILVDDADQDGSAVAASMKINGYVEMFYTVLGA